MFKTALVALDLSPAEAPMLACLDEIGALGLKRLVLLHVVEVGYIAGAEYGHEEQIAARLKSHAERLEAAGFAVTTEVRDSGTVSGTILQAAADHRADLIVIGSRGQNMLRGLFLGSVAREVIRLSALPVRLEWIEATGKEGDAACERACHGGFRRVLLATDFSRQSQSAEKVAIELARRGAHVDVLNVLTPGNKKIYARWPRMAQAALSYIVADIVAEGGKAEMHLRQGKPSEEIAQAAAERDADLIVVGKHGQTWVESIAIGSTAANLCEIARRPVLMVPLKMNEV